jgi:hypothetical protein
MGSYRVSCASLGAGSVVALGLAGGAFGVLLLFAAGVGEREEGREGEEEAGEVHGVGVMMKLFVV